MSSVYADRRDTDADWQMLGATDPYYGVLTNPEYRREVMGAAERRRFFETGREDIAYFSHLIAKWTGEAPSGGRALDFGCGVGRLTEAMAAVGDEVYGYDISDGMLNEARSHAGRAHYTSILPEGPFDWINSYIVFQHMPREKGMERLEALLQRLAPGGAVSLQFTVLTAEEDAEAEAQRHRTPPWELTAPPALARFWLRAAWVIGVLIEPDTAPPPPAAGRVQRRGLPLLLRPSPRRDPHVRLRHGGDRPRPARARRLQRRADRDRSRPPGLHLRWPSGGRGFLTP